MEYQPGVIAENVVVSLEYKLTVDGQVIDSTEEGRPLEYIQGHNNIIPGLERELVGLAIGASKEVYVAAVDAYGEIDPEAFTDVDRGQFPPEFPLEIGRPLRVSTTDGHILNARITDIAETSVRLDLNHPLAGKDLLFQATINGLRPATEEEIMHGRVGGGCGGGCSSTGCGSSGCCSDGCN